MWVGGGMGGEGLIAQLMILFHFILFIFPQQMLFIICAYTVRALGKNPGH